jgi:uncharacterized protein
MNRLAHESSPYLLLHKDNPVDWYPWGQEALARAKAEDKPIFLSVGYSTCYWCHVMERESFTDPDIAELVNERFVCIKVDREERPEIDDLYMTATQILAGQGGWPNSVFLTPALAPFYAGTYFPPTDRHGRPGFANVVVSLAEAWRERRGDVEMQAEEVLAALRRLQEQRAVGAAPPAGTVAHRAYAGLVRGFDDIHGGFGGAPKFPSPANLYLLHALADDTEAPRAAEMLGRTLEALGRGGIYDQLGGGFHRYATDGAWLVPHFEKMLYDNALLLELCAMEAERRRGDRELERVARETVAFLAREMTGPRGELWSAIDAETHGHEGAFYVWSSTELSEVLGEEDAAFLAPIYGFDRDPFFENSAYVLHLPKPVAELAAARRCSVAELWAEIAPLRDRLFAARAERERPLTDDKILADWNGMAIRGLAEAGRVFGNAEMLARARAAADFVLTEMRPAGGPLLHAVRGGEGKVAAFLSDYVFLVRGLLALARATSEDRYLAAAVELTDEQIDRLAHPQGGFYNAAASPDLLVRNQEIFDGATPSANGMAVLNLLELHTATGDDRYRERAAATLAAYAPVLERAPEAAKTLALAAWRFGELSEPVAVRYELAPAGADGTRPFVIQLDLRIGWHLDGAALTVEAVAGSEIVELVKPEGDFLTGVVVLTGRLRGSGELILGYQACDETACRLPVRQRLEPTRSA